MKSVTKSCLVSKALSRTREKDEICIAFTIRKGRLLSMNRLRRMNERPLCKKLAALQSGMSRQLVAMLMT